MRALVRQTSSDGVSVGKAGIDWCMGSWGFGGCAAGVGVLFTWCMLRRVCAWDDLNLGEVRDYQDLCRRRWEEMHI